MKYLLYLLLLFIILIIFYLLNIILKNKTLENFCKIPNVDSRGDINDKRVELNYPPQSNIRTSSCEEYWKDWPMESNNLLVDNEPIVIKSDQLELPKEKQFGDNQYTSGLVNFSKLANVVSDKIDYDIFEKSKELLYDPLTKKKLNYIYEVNFEYIILNKKTWFNRWYNYNPSVKTTFNYEEIKSSINDINILNLEFKERFDTKQREILSNNQLFLYGLIPFQIFKYKILSIRYFENNVNKPIYIIQIVLFRESDLYINTFSYIGFIDNKNIFITNVKYIGRNATDNVLLADFYNPKDIHQEIINKNFSNTPILNKNPDSIVQLMKDHQEAFKLKNQYACFNINYDPSKKEDNILPYYSRESCESSVDTYNRPKSVGIYDTPCKKNEDCPFYKINKNYDNEFGKCMENGKCELPSNMVQIGYKYFKNNKENKPLCYNCDSSKFIVNSQLNTCCDDQYDRKKYPLLKSPDYAFDDDFLNRKNYYNNKFCYTKENSLDVICNQIIL
jgi:hypothetical protein